MRERRCCIFCDDVKTQGLEFGARGFTFGICKACAIKLIGEMRSEFKITSASTDKDEVKNMRATIKYLQQDRNKLEELLMLVKKTVVAFADAYQAQRHGHSNLWENAAKMYQKCEDEMDLD